MTIESRRVWHRLTYAIVKRDYPLSSTVKNEIEQEQRDLRKLRENQGEKKWQERYFSTKDNEHWVYENFTCVSSECCTCVCIEKNGCANISTTLFSAAVNLTSPCQIWRRCRCGQ